jgi:hypothetical protein
MKSEHIDLGDEVSVQRWAAAFGLTEADLRKAMRSAGTDVQVLRYLLLGQTSARSG